MAARGYTYGDVRSNRQKLNKHGATVDSIVDHSESSRTVRASEEDPCVVSKHVGDYMPDKIATVLPYCKFEGVYGEYKLDMKSSNLETCHDLCACRLFYTV